MRNEPHIFSKETPAPPPGILVCDYYDKPYGYSCYRSAGTKDWLIMYTTSGKGIVRNLNQSYTCTEGVMTILPPGIAHDYFTAEDNKWGKMWAHFLPKPDWIPWLQLSKSVNPLIHFHFVDTSVQAKIQTAFNRLLTYNLDELNAFREELAMNALEEIILLLANERTETATDLLDPRIKETMNFLTQNYFKSIQFEELAQLVCLSPSRLSHLFKEQVGETIMEALLKLRLKQAVKLLKFTNRPITQVALDVGFNSPDFFTRKFSAFYGMNPSSYRKNRPQSASPAALSNLTRNE